VELSIRAIDLEVVPTDPRFLRLDRSNELAKRSIREIDVEVVAIEAEFRAILWTGERKKRPIEAINPRIEPIKPRIEAVNSRIAAINSRIAAINSRIDENKLGVVEPNLDEDAIHPSRVALRESQEDKDLRLERSILAAPLESCRRKALALHLRRSRLLLRLLLDRFLELLEHVVHRPE